MSNRIQPTPKSSETGAKASRITGAVILLVSVAAYFVALSFASLSAPGYDFVHKVFALVILVGPATGVVFLLSPWNLPTEDGQKNSVAMRFFHTSAVVVGAITMLLISMVALVLTFARI